MSHPSIPSEQSVKDQNIRMILSAVRINVETLNGKRDGRIDLLSTSATTAEIIAKINEIIERLQG